jgi:hypothetical protein
MSIQDLDSVISDVYRSTHRLWQSSRQALTGEHDHGFKILYGPPRCQPAVLVIGLQPGGTAANIRDAELLRPSNENEYLSETWTLATELRKRLGTPYLQEAIGTNAIFFRAPKHCQWLQIDQRLRTQLETFCAKANRRLIDAMQPKRLLLLGWEALALMGEGGFHELVANGPGTDRPRRSRLLQSGVIRGIPAFAIPHPSSAWRNPPVTDQDWVQIATRIGAIGS